MKGKRKGPARPIVRALIGAALLGFCQLLSGAETEWISLFDGKTLKGWKITDFGGPPDEVRVEDGDLIVEMGAADMAGVTCTAAVPRVDYELTLEAKRLEGNDMFCCLTFPVQGDHCSLIVGGWGGTLIGLSSLDNLDASQNETTTFMEFKSNTWYRIRLRVTAKRIQAWIGDKEVVDARLGDRKISVRWEVERSRPLGLATWNTKAAMRDIRLRRLSATEVEATERDE